ncbi:MFS transporter [Paenibacillus radicis (ex Gao et al. 2016)]|uniref:MFS transporter n=1 Tax=Paenibacillus radicis (ex Gao et al. 2016) TaxID=1737354 RepID=A0A917LUI7_9BACL|nr:MFS transporter [Paenibacillus radicis (ex Gao et al. 2016)]GGG58789.1 MFS transporter [Paenibacillus radicis (ex Gao et al. 2016)]
MNDTMNIQQEKLWTKSFIMLTVSYLLLFLSLQMLLSPFPAYAKEQFHPGNFTVSLVTSLFALSAIATRFATASLLRFIHRNTILLFGIVLAATVTFLYPYAATMTQLLVLRVLFGIGFGMTSTVLPTLVSQIIPHKRLGEGVGYFGLSTSLAMSIGPMIGLSVIKNYGFETLSMIGTVAAFAIIPLLLLTRSIPAQSEKPKSTQRKATAAISSDGSKDRQGNMLVPALLNMLMSVSYGGLLGFLALFGQEKKLDGIGLFFLFIACTVLIIRPISGRIFDRRGPALVLIPGAIIIIASMLILSYANSMPLVIVSALLYGLGFGAIQPTTQAWMLREASPERHGTANSLYYNSTDFGVAAGSMLLGIIASATSYSMMYRYAACVMVLFLIVYSIQHILSRKSKNSSRSNAVAKS